MIKQFLRPTIGKVIFTFFSVIFIWSQGINFLELIYTIILSYLFWSLILFIYIRIHINDYVNNINNFIPILFFIFSIAFFIIEQMPSGDAIKNKRVSLFLFFSGVGQYTGRFIYKKTNLNCKEKAIRNLLWIICIIILSIFYFIDTTAATSQFITASLIGFLFGTIIGFEEGKLKQLKESTNF